jgi:hypothetical protein
VVAAVVAAVDFNDFPAENEGTLSDPREIKKRIVLMSLLSLLE